MMKYEVDFSENIKQLTKAMQDISKDIHAIREHLVPIPIKEEEVIQEPIQGFTYGEVCKMKEEFDECRDMLKRTEEFRNDR